MLLYEIKMPETWKARGQCSGAVSFDPAVHKSFDPSYIDTHTHVSSKTISIRMAREAEEVASKVLVDCEKEQFSKKDVLALVIKHLQLQDEISVR